jgi:hypothetical protein
MLRLNELNLLSSDSNCIQSSTSIGFCMEEFVVSKLMAYTKNKPGSKLLILRDSEGTTQTSYDCFATYKNELYLINFKANAGGNNAVSAINKLHKEYVIDKPKDIKHFFVLKVDYSIGFGKDNQKKILIKKVHGFFIEEVDFNKGHRQDSRN